VESSAAVIVTPSETDARVALSFLTEAGIAGRACPSLAELCKLASGEVGCAVLVEEALVHPDIDDFLSMLAAQPPWSDLPLVLLASQGAALGALVERVFPESGNVAVLERPMNPVSLVSAVRVGLRARQRQFQVRELLEQRSTALRQRDEFLAMLSHELRNPLAPMRNAAYLMKRLDIDNALFVKTRDLMERQVTHMARLVDDLLDVSRLELGKVQLKMRSVDLNAAISAAAETCLPMIAAREQTLKLELPPEPGYIRADPVRLEQIICNLITNAAKFTPEGGKIIVEAWCDPGNASLTVRDSGIGIDARMLSSVFDLFTQDATTLERSQGGLGIGLTIVKRLVELHGGTIRVASEGRDRGAQFTVTFPRHVPKSAERKPQAPEPAHGSSKRVLVIEDNPDIRESLGLLLNLWGHGVDYAESGPDGVQQADATRPDVALIDIGLPGLSGYEVARHIRSLDSEWARGVRLIALTGYGRDSDREKAAASGFDSHLVKPVDPDVLEALLKLT
jgi:signal transduction histidine kinase